VLGRRWTLITLFIVAVVVIGTAIAAVIALHSTTPSGVVTLPDDVLSQYVKYVEHKYPEGGKADPGICFSRKREPRTTYKGYPIFGCTVTQRRGPIAMRLECVASTNHGIKTPADGKSGWPAACIRLP
jgi:hypothetical protein